MSEQSEEALPAAAATEEPHAPPEDRRGAAAAVAIALGTALALVVALTASAPWWAPYLPWGPGASRHERALAARLDRLAAGEAAAREESRQAADDAGAAVRRLGQRVAALEARPSPPSPDDVAAMRRQLAKLEGEAAALASRIDALAGEVHAEAARGAGDTALALVLLQVRNAVAAGRPFAAEYRTLERLAQSRPAIAKAIAPLAAAAQTGVASRAVLAKRLRELGAALAAANTEAAPSGWAGEALARLRRLVTIRRVGGGGAAGGPQGAVGAAQAALADGDLKGAVAALAGLTGAPATQAAPWLREARARLAVEDALDRVAALLTAGLGDAADGAGAGR